jgi:hypothetical protein
MIAVAGLHEVIVLRVMLRLVVPAEPMHLHRGPQRLIALDRAAEAVGLVALVAPAVRVLETQRRFAMLKLSTV